MVSTARQLTDEGGLFGEESARLVRRYLLTRGEDIELFGGEKRIEGMTLKQLLAAVKEHGTAEDIRVLNRQLLAPLFMRLDRRVDDDDIARSENIRRANEEFNVVAVASLPSGVPEDEKLIDQFDRRSRYPSIAQMLDSVKAWVTGEGPAMLTVAGSVGVGKTLLAIAAANQLLQRGEIVVYRREPELITDLQAHIKTKDVDKQMQEYCQTPWLVVDDFGTAAQGDWTRAKMDELIDARWRMADGGAIRTLITTNLFPEDLPTRVASRLDDASRGRAVKVDAPDYRRNGKR